MLGSVIDCVNLTTGLGIFVVSSIGYLMYRSVSRPSGFPPGPDGLPLLGNVLMFRGDTPPFELFKNMGKKYGDVFSIKIATRWVVVLNSIDVVKDSLLRKQDQFAGRPDTYTMEILTQGYKDIAFSSFTETWKIHRKIGHNALRTFASGKKLEKLVFSMTEKMAHALEELSEESFDPKDMMGLIVYNILASMCFGHEYAYDDPRIQEWIDINKEQYEILGNGLLADYFPFMRYLPTPGWGKMMDFFNRYLNLIRTEYDDHQKSYNPENIRDLTDCLMKAQQDAIDEGSQKADSLTDTHLVQTVGDVFGAGTETTILTFLWAFALLCEHPEIQTKVAEELDRVIGRDRLPSMDDRGKLPYTEATLYEIFRFGSVAPLGVPHATTEDVVLCGYTIPKDTMVMVNHWALHRDERYWDEPFEFKPEHFLDEGGEVRQHPNSYLPFSIGRRVCLGEGFAKAETFLLFCWLFQHYTFSKPSGDTEPGSFLPLDLSTGFAHMPKPYKMVAKKRF